MQLAVISSGEQVNIMGIYLERYEQETWRQVVARYSQLEGKRTECLASYDWYLSQGTAEALAAVEALKEWDCAPYQKIGSRSEGCS
jgi:hypothetical protein